MPRFIGVFDKLTSSEAPQVIIYPPKKIINPKKVMYILFSIFVNHMYSFLPTIPRLWGREGRVQGKQIFAKPGDASPPPQQESSFLNYYLNSCWQNIVCTPTYSTDTFIAYNGIYTPLIVSLELLYWAFLTHRFLVEIVSHSPDIPPYFASSIASDVLIMPQISWSCLWHCLRYPDIALDILILA